MPTNPNHDELSSENTKSRVIDVPSHSSNLHSNHQTNQNPIGTLIHSDSIIHTKPHSPKSNKLGIDENHDEDIDQNYTNLEQQKMNPPKNKKNQKVSVLKRFKSFLGKHRKSIQLVSLIGFVVALGVGVWLSIWLVDIWNNKSTLAGLGEQPNQSSVVYARDGTTEIYRYYEEENRQVVPLSDISENMQAAIIALEDENFYYNESGIPWTNIVGASVTCAVSTGDNCRGGSGLSQQLIKNVKNDDESTVDRKVRELFTAIKLNEESTKPEILEKYLNWVPFGRNAYGVEQASKVYFDKPAKELDPVESCYLASMVQRPSYFNSGIGNPESQANKDLEIRKNVCLQKLYEVDIFPGKQRQVTDTQQLSELKSKQITFAQAGKNDAYPHFKDFVDREIEKFVNPQDLLTGGYTIVTSLDPNIQKAAQDSIQARSQEDIIAAGGNNAALVALDGPTGQIVAMVGSLDYNNQEIDGQVNVATSPRQPGSSIKPYVYAASFKKGLNPGSVLLDTQTTFDGNYTPKNFSGSFVGPVTIRNSLANSYNIPAVKAAYLSSDNPNPNPGTGITAVFETAEQMGLEFPCIPAADGSLCDSTEEAKTAYRRRCGISAALGGCEVTLLSHVTGMNTFAQEGKLREATPFVSIKDRFGNDVYRERQTSNNPVYQVNDSAIDPRVARQIDSIMSDYDARRTAFGRTATRLELAGWNGANSVAAKTGTTNDVKDTWTVGFSPYYSVAVWVGNTDGTPLKNNASSVGTTSGIWNDVMVKLHEGKEKRGFSKEGLQPVALDRVTGLPIEGGQMYTEWLTDQQLNQLKAAVSKFNSPTDYDPKTKNFRENLTTLVVTRAKVNKLDGKLAVEGKTLPENIEDKQFLQLIAEYPAWQSTADALMAKAPNNYSVPPKELSDQDQVNDQKKGPEITSSLDQNKTDLESITITAKPQGQATKTISRIELFIDGITVASAQDSETLTFNEIEELGNGTKQILIKATDNLGVTTEKTYSNVTFKKQPTPPVVIEPEPLTQAELGSLDIICEIIGLEEYPTCIFDLEEKTSLPDDFVLRIGTSTSGECDSILDEDTGLTTVTCEKSEPNEYPTVKGSYPIQVRIGSGQFTSTKNQYKVE